MEPAFLVPGLFVAHAPVWAAVGELPDRREGLQERHARRNLHALRRQRLHEPHGHAGAERGDRRRDPVAQARRAEGRAEAAGGQWDEFVDVREQIFLRALEVAGPSGAALK